MEIADLMLEEPLFAWARGNISLLHGSQRRLVHARWSEVNENYNF